MANSTSLPVYDAKETQIPTTDTKSEAPPAYVLQKNFQIGTHSTPPLVTPNQLQTHLNLLKAFNDLRTKIEQGGEGLPSATASLDADKRWVWFLQLAVERFHLWTKNSSFTTEKDFVAREIPPLDVWMVWHAYMLNPIWYSEDCQRESSLRCLRKLNGWSSQSFVLDVLADMGNLSSFKPTPDQNAHWVQVTGVPFDPVESSYVLLEKDLLCPECSTAVKAPYIAFERDAGIGYAQRDFKLLCPKCNHQITKSTLSVAKFATDIARDPKDIPAVLAFGDGVYLPGTLHSPLKKIDVGRARKIKVSVLGSSVFRKPRASTPTKAWEDYLKTNVEYSMLNVKKHLDTVLKPLLVQKILGAYNDDLPFSIDLVGAILRQGTFIDKMNELGWTRPEFFVSKEDQVALNHCVARYHAFLDLMTNSPGSFLVPTLDIDLVWHTHQLCPGRYSDDCMKYIERYVNHDDKVEESRLSTSFDVTCRAWERRFKGPYLHCGCPLPGDTIGQKLSRLCALLHSHKDPMIPPSRDDSLLATHPSDHNSIYISGMSHGMRQKRLIKVQKHRARDLTKVKAGKLDEKTYKRGNVHDNAFLVPVPMYYTLGYIGYAGACGSGIGSCTWGNAGCGGCSAGCSGGCGSGCGGSGCGGGGSSSSHQGDGNGGGCGGGVDGGEGGNDGGGGCGGGGGGCGGGGD